MKNVFDEIQERDEREAVYDAAALRLKVTSLVLVLDDLRKAVDDLADRVTKVEEPVNRYLGLTR